MKKPNAIAGVKAMAGLGSGVRAAQSSSHVISKVGSTEGMYFEKDVRQDD